MITTEVRARAALHVVDPLSYASHLTAAELWGLPVTPDGFTRITVPTEAARLRRQGVRSHLAAGGRRVVERRGTP